MIRKGTAADLDRAEAIYHAILDYQAAHTNYTNWVKGLYPTRDTARKAVEAGTFFVLEEAGQVVATANLNQIQPPEYAKIPWSLPARPEEVLVIHTLCVPPDQAGKGYGRAFVAFAEDYGRRLRCRVIRLDTYEGNQPAAAMYRKLGYRAAGITFFHFEGVIDENLLCFEKAL